MWIHDGTSSRLYAKFLCAPFSLSFQSVDDRTAEERGLEPLKNNKFVIKKSRYDSTDCYIYPCSAPYNDIPLEYDEAIYNQLREGGIDEHLSKHVAHMFIRDPLQVLCL